WIIFLKENVSVLKQRRGEAYSEQVAEQYGGVNFLVCATGVNPLVGSTLGASEQVWDKVQEEENLIQPTKKLFGMQRIGQPEECAGIMFFLCSPDSSFITGQNIVVAGFSPST
uniref:Dehydrogenase/reductase 2 n=1 Tax=Vombatus ursinus TaxID=29139 RepID=A0A4X2M6A9_VOMUR